MNLKKLFGRKRYEKYQEERDKAELLRRDGIIREGKNLEFWKVLKEEVEEEILKAIELLIYPNLMREYGLENDLNEVQYLRGMIFDARIYNIALSQAEIKSEMWRFAIPDSSCKGMWRLDEGAMNLAPGGVDCTDISGNGNHGTCTNMGGDEDWVAGPPITPLLG